MDTHTAPGAASGASHQQPIFIPPALFAYSILYGGMVCIAGVLGTKLASLGTWPLLGSLAVESGIFAFLLLVALSSAVAELYGRELANKLVRYGFIPLIVSMLLIMLVIHVFPPASFWGDQEIFKKILGQGARMQFAGLIAYGVSQSLNVGIFSRLAGPATDDKKSGMLLFRAWIAGIVSQVVDTVLFITIAFYGVTDAATGQPIPIGQIMEGQIISKLVLSTIMVPPLIYFFVALGRWLDRKPVLDRNAA